MLQPDNNKKRKQHDQAWSNYNIDPRIQFFNRSFESPSDLFSIKF